MKTLVTRSLALLLTLALLFTVTPFTALAEAAENEDGMDEIMDILETYEEETEVSAEPGEALTDSTEETVPAEDASEEDQPIEDDSEETAITDEKPETSDLPEMPEEEIILDDPGIEDDWADWYTDDQPEEESEDTKVGRKIRYLTKFNEINGKTCEDIQPIFGIIAAHNTNSFDKRLKAYRCELCGYEGKDRKYEIHHVNKVKNLKGKEPWERAMISKRRKTLVVCHDCHQKIHHGF